MAVRCQIWHGVDAPGPAGCRDAASPGRSRWARRSACSRSPSASAPSRPADRWPRRARCRCSCSPGRRSSAPSASSPPAAPTAAALGGAMILAARNGVYGLAMSRVLGGSLGHGACVAAHLVIDESTAMATAQRDRARPARRLLDHRRRGLRVLEPRHAARRPRRLGDRPADVRPRRRLPGRVRGDGRAAACATASACSPALLGAAICLVLIPFTPVGVPILCASAAVLVGIPRTATADDGRRRSCPARAGRAR